MSKACEDCDHYDFDTQTCMIDDLPKENIEICVTYKNSKGDEYYYYGD